MRGPAVLLIVLLFVIFAMSPGLKADDSPGLRADDPADFSRARWAPSGWERQLEFEKQLLALPDPENLRKSHDLLCQEPHVAGSEADGRVIDKLAEFFADLDLEVEVHDIWVYLARPIEARLEIVTKHGSTQLSVQEFPVEGDTYSEDKRLYPGWNAYSGSGDVTAGVVYANYGTREDFARLRELNVDIAGKIVLARYGRNYRGFKAKFAEEGGAAGLVMFTDPEDSGYHRGLMYPEGGWANGSHIQRGSVKTLPYPGDPLTPFREATENAERLDPSAVALATIPVQPVGWNAAAHILKLMTGTPAPDDWQGGLPLTYRLSTGDSELRVRLKVVQERAIKKTANVLATLRGTKGNGQIIMGCHHDAWSFGAGDPQSGTILVMECARSFALAAKAGHRPDRDIVFAHWGAEEFGIIGSVEFCEGRAEELRQRGVAYINLDMATMGPNFRSSAAPLLKSAIADAAGAVPSLGEGSILDDWRARSGGKEPRFGNLGGGSDHIGFYSHLGIPSCGIGAGGSPGVSYHSNYETLTWYRKVVGDDYEPARMLTRLVNILTARLANATVLPLDPTRYVPDLEEHLLRIEERARALDAPWPKEDIAALRSDLARLDLAARATHRELTDAIEQGQVKTEQLARINDVIRRLERNWLDDAGLPERPWYRSLYAASDPDSGYAAWMLPGIRLAVERRESVTSHVDAIRRVLEKIGRDLLQISLLLK